jgi:hypothetical protein
MSKLTDYRRLEYGWDELPRRAFRAEGKNPVVRVIFTRLATNLPLGDPSDPGGEAVIEIERRTGRRERLRQRIVRHSPTGLEFGYGGSGPADCAANVLALILPMKEAWRLHQDFKSAFVARLPRDGGTVEMVEVRAWVEARWAREAEEALAP